jgi:signal transduction histidine kinase
MSGRPPELQEPVEGVAAEALLLAPGARPHGLAPAAAALLDKLPGGVFQLLRSSDGRWTFPYVNAEAQRMLGMSAAGLRRDARSVRAVLHPADLAHLKQRLDQSRETGVTWKARFRLQRLNAPKLWVEVTASPESRSDAGTMWTGLLADVHYEHTRQNAAQNLHERQMQAVRAAELGLVDIDLAAGQVRFDAQARLQHGLDITQTEVSLSHWLDLLLPEDRAAAQQALATASEASEHKPHTVLLHARSADRQGVRALELALTRTVAAFDAPPGSPGQPRLVGVCRDITAHREREDERCLNLAGEMAERSRNDFLSRISHELRTPLNGVLGYAQLMALDREHPLPRTQSQRLAVLQESSARLLSLVDQLLEVSGIDRGEVALHPEVVDLRPLIARCVSNAAAAAQDRGVDIEVALGDEDSGGPSAHVRADPQALEQVIQALLSNAIKFNRSPGRVRIRFVSAEMGTVLIDDTGPGLTPEQLGRLFEPLNRLGAERTRVPGNGLGLTTARKLTQAMGGKLKAWSQPGTGSRFAVSLALAKPERPVGAPESDFAGLAPSGWDGGVQRVVLYVEDDEVNTTLMEQVFLMRPEWRLITAASGEDGVAAALAHLPELALIDIGLPGISGIEVMQKLRGDLRTQHIHCVALSADTSAESIERARAAGFEDYWTKPFDILTMVGQLKSLLA